MDLPSLLSLLKLHHISYDPQVLPTTAHTAIPSALSTVVAALKLAPSATNTRVETKENTFWLHFMAQSPGIYKILAKTFKVECVIKCKATLQRADIPNNSTNMIKRSYALLSSTLRISLPDQVQGYQQRLEFILGGSEDCNANSTSFQARDANSSTRRLAQHPPSSSPTTSYPSSFRESVESNASSVVDQMYLFLIFIYHILLLRLPTTYASLALDALCQEDDEICDANVWETFTDILLKQWKTIGLLSTLIFGFASSALVIFVVDITSSSGLLVIVHCALLCAMMSLIYTSFLSVYFGSWRSSSTAERWVKEMRTASPHSLWNFWVLISLPVAWTCWGIFLFLTSMVLFAWPLSQYDSSQDSLDGVQESLGIRIFVMMVLVAGGVHLGCMIYIA
ncbi:hypothetical protein DFH09DRAFT_1348205 [Mycena vulgaris]|nr:hypothetical protein DFH09DRAFT_1348205 [Mycena vulgaris]